MNYENLQFKYDFSEIQSLKRELAFLDERELLMECRKRWYSAFEKLYESGEHVVPLSGGLDSRAVLGTLLEFVEASKICTFTFGTPGSLDFELGGLIAKKVGSKHKEFPFKDYTFSTEKEISVSQRTDNQTILFHHPPLEELDLSYKDFFMWSGFMLDWIAGSHAPAFRSNDIKLAVENNIKRDRFVKSIDLSTSTKVNYEVSNLVDSSIVSYEEQIEGMNRYPKYIAPNIIYKDFNFMLPGNELEIFNFFFALSDSLRKNESFYIEFLKNEFTELFRLPVKSMHGLTFESSPLLLKYKKIKNGLYTIGKKVIPSIVHPHTNYMDFEEGIRKREDLNKVINQNLQDLIKRKIVDFIDINRIYSNHMNRRGNHADILIALASLEIHLKAGRKI